MTEEQPGQQDELFTTRMREETTNIPNFTNFAISLKHETVHDRLFIFYPIFAFLEDAKERLKMPEYDKLFVHESLFKKKAFEEDLTYYLGAKSRMNFLLCKSLHINDDEPLQKYLKHLEKLEREDPKRLLAYVYHLYLGLLSGGQILAKKRKVFGESIFACISEVTDFTRADFPQDFHAAMNELTEGMTEVEKMAFLVESYYNVMKKNNVKDSYTDKVTDFTDADIPQMKNGFHSVVNELAKDLTEDVKIYYSRGEEYRLHREKRGNKI